MSKIKLYKIGHEEQDIVVTFTPEQWNNLSSDVRLVYKMLDVIHVEYEPELLKRQDGSLISEPEKGVKIIHIYQHRGDFKLNICNGELFISSYDNHHEQYLLNGFIFLPEDKELAEKKAKMLTKQLEIQYEIDRLNAENNNENMNLYLCLKDSAHHRYYEEQWSEYSAICFHSESGIGTNKVSKKVLDIILKKYSQDELKQYLGLTI
jgi:hypothetical protein